MNRSGRPRPHRRRSHPNHRRRPASHPLWVLVLTVALAVVADLPGPGYADELHTLRTELAEARAALRDARLDAATVAPAAGLAHGAGAGVRGRGSPTQVRAADRRVRAVEAALAEVEADAGQQGLVAGLVEQVRALVRKPDDADTAGVLLPPVRGIVTSGFGRRQVPSWGEEMLHNGIDIFALPGTAVRAAAAGIVVAAGEQDRAGLHVVVDHGTDADGRTLRTVYSHLARIDVRPGQRIGAGQQIATVGSTGSHTTGPHLHFEVHLEGEPVDPRAWL